MQQYQIFDLHEQGTGKVIMTLCDMFFMFLHMEPLGPELPHLREHAQHYDGRGPNKFDKNMYTFFGTTLENGGTDKDIILHEANGLNDAAYV
jgi:hypothetical protein